MILCFALQVKAKHLLKNIRQLSVALKLFMVKRLIVLASTSPYRRELLERLRIPFEVINPDIDESALPNETPQATALRLSEAKARAGSSQFPDALIIGSDQVAILDGKIYGKPGSHERAVEQLRTLSGRSVEFFTGLSVFDTSNKRSETRGVATQVGFRTLTDSEILNYLEKEPAYNCAGSAKSEGLGIALLSYIRGDDPNALIGLPLIALCDLLRKHGENIL